MGANISTNVNEMEREIKTSLKQSCTPKVGVTQQINGNYIVLRGRAKCGTISFKNDARITSTCNMDSTATVLAKYATKLTEKQKAGLGLNISTNINKNKEIISTELEQKCGASANLTQEMNNNRIEIWDNAQCDMIEFMNTSDVTSSCVMKLVANATSDIIKVTDKDQQGGSLLGMLGLDNLFGLGALGGLGAMGGPSSSSSSSSSLCCCCLLIILVLFMTMGSGDSKE